MDTESQNFYWVLVKEIQNFSSFAIPSFSDNDNVITDAIGNYTLLGAQLAENSSLLPINSASPPILYVNKIQNIYFRIRVGTKVLKQLNVQKSSARECAMTLGPFKIICIIL